MYKIAKLSACLIAFAGISTAAHAGNNTSSAYVPSQAVRSAPVQHSAAVVHQRPVKKKRIRIVREPVVKPAAQMVASRSDGVIIFHHDANAKTRIVQPREQVASNMPNLFRK